MINLNRGYHKTNKKKKRAQNDPKIPLHQKGKNKNLTKWQLPAHIFPALQQPKNCPAESQKYPNMAWLIQLKIPSTSINLNL